MAARAGWNLTAQRVVRNPDVIDLQAILDRIESEMEKAASEVQWTMNTTFAEIGIHFPEHRKRANTIGETLGVFRDCTVSKRLYLAIRPNLDLGNGEQTKLNHQKIKKK